MGKIVNHQIYTGEWRKIKWNGYLVGCCDCRLIHEHNFKTIGQDLYMKTKLRPKLTAQARQNL